MTVAYRRILHVGDAHRLEELLVKASHLDLVRKGIVLVSDRVGM